MNYELLRYHIEDLQPCEVIEYLRKSRSDDPSLSVEEVLERHEGILRDWAVNTLGQAIPEANIYREVLSGETISERPEIQKALKKIEVPTIRAILVVEPQRLSRGDLEDIGRLMKLIKYTNTLLITPVRIYDLQNRDDFDSLERELKRGNEFLEYTKTILNRGRLRSVSEGNYIGTVPPYGYDKVFVKVGKKKCPTLAINEEQADVVRMIFDMYVNQDMGCWNICYKLDELGIKPPKGKRWSANSLPDMLSNQHYIGKVVWNWRKTVTVVEDSEIIKTRPKAKEGDYLIYEGKHTAIITEEMFKAAQAKRGRKHRAKPSTKVRNPLASLLYCTCGRAMSLRTYKRPDGSERNAPRLLCDGQAFCGNGSALYTEILDQVKNTLRQSIEDFKVKLKNNESNSYKMHTTIITKLEKRIKELEKAELNLWNEKAQNRGTDDEMPDHIFKQLRDNIKAEQQEVSSNLAKAYDTMPTPIDYKERIATFKTALEALEDDAADAELQNRLLKSCIDKIIYSRQKPVRLTKKNIAEYNELELQTGGNWFAPPFELEIRLKV